MTEENKGQTYEEELQKLEIIDEICARTGVEFLVAKQALEKNGGQLLEAIAQIEQQKQEEQEAKKVERKEKYWQNPKENLVEATQYVKEKCNMVTAQELVAEMKTSLKKPIDCGQVGEKKLQLPAGVVGAGILTALYPFHRSKGLTAVAATAMGAWFLNRNHGLSKAKMAISKATEEYNSQFDGVEFPPQNSVEKPEQQTENQGDAEGNAQATAAQPATEAAHLEAFHLDEEGRQDAPGIV